MGRLKLISKKFLSALPPSGKRVMSHLDYRLSAIPRVYHDRRRHPSQGLWRGAVTFSLDFELAWAWQYARQPQNEDCVSRGLRERDQVPQILDKFDQFNIPATWATVGHLFLRECTRRHQGMAHAGMPRLQHFENDYWRFSSGDWYQHDPCSDVRRDPAWYAPDLIESILGSRVVHEIACHSFSHASFGAYCPPVVAAAELDACFEAMKPYSVRPTTWVFPRHDAGNFAVLAEKGFRIVRCFPKPWAKISLPLHRADGMWAVHVSSSTDRGDGWTLEQRLTRLKRYVDKAASTRMAAHIWLHPSLPPTEMNELLFPILHYCADQRERGLLDILTMDQLVSATEAALREERIHS